MKHVQNERSFFPSLKSGRRAGVSVAALLLATMFTLGAAAQTTAPIQPTDPAQTTGAAATTDAAQAPDAVLNSTKKGKKEKEEKVVQSKDTKRELKKTRRSDPLVGVDSKLPDKQLFDKAMEQTKKGHYDVARLDLQTLLNTYPDSQYQMRSKLAIADSWYKEGGTAALTQAEAEYKDFTIFFPNVPEAAEAQMRIGDIYFRQMDKPDRDYAKAVHAQEEYRHMLTDYPDSVLVTDAKQRLREVQEVLAVRESEIAAFYSTHANWPATIARYQTVVDSYPQYSHMDDVLVGLGDAYEAEARYVRTLKLPEAGKARLEKTYDDLAIASYRQVVLQHAASPHVEDARDRLAALNVAIPTPTPEQMAASAALENSRRSYRLQDRLSLLILHKPDTVLAATNGEPTLTDPKPTLAPTVYKQILTDFSTALNPNAPKPVAAATDAPATDGTAAPAADGTAAPAPLALQDVPAAGADSGGGGTSTMTAAPAAGSSGATGNSVGVEILTPGVKGSTAAPDTGGLKVVGPKDSAPLPAVEKAGPAPDAVNDIPAGAAPAGQTPNPNAKGKNPKPEFDKSDESSSKHKKKKGLNKINPF